MAKWRVEIRRIAPTTIMVENCGIGGRCRDDPSIGQRTSCGTARPSYLARTRARVQCHRSGSIGLEASANQFADRLDIRGVRRRAILPRLFTHARSRRLGTINPGLLDRHDPCFIAFRLWSLLQRPSGVLDSTYSGLVLGAAYLVAGRNLWAPVLTHGIADTIAIFVVFMSWTK